MTRGFTLIETVIYLALLALIIACSFRVLGSAGEASATGAASASTLMEGNFAVEKIAYAFAHDVDASVTVSGGTLYLYEGGEMQPLTSSRVTASGLAVTETGEGREVSFLIDGTAFSAEVDAP